MLHAEEERFLRMKHAVARLPEYAIRSCLKHAGIGLQDVHSVAYNYATIDGMDRRLEEWFRFRFGHSPRIRVIPHYLAHAASAYRLSGYDEALTFSADVSGDSVSTFITHGQGDKITPLKVIKRPNSLGLFYSMITQFLGFDRDNDEYKVMGLASYGEQEEDLSFLLTWEQGDHHFHFEKYMVPVGPQSPFPSKQESIFTPALVERLSDSLLLEPPALGGQELSQPLAHPGQDRRLGVLLMQLRQSVFV